MNMSLWAARRLVGVFVIQALERTAVFFFFSFVAPPCFLLSTPGSNCLLWALSVCLGLCRRSPGRKVSKETVEKRCNFFFFLICLLNRGGGTRITPTRWGNQRGQVRLCSRRLHCGCGSSAEPKLAAGVMFSARYEFCLVRRFSWQLLQEVRTERSWVCRSLEFLRSPLATNGSR